MNKAKYDMIWAGSHIASDAEISARPAGRGIRRDLIPTTSVQSEKQMKSSSTKKNPTIFQKP